MFECLAINEWKCLKGLRVVASLSAAPYLGKLSPTTLHDGHGSALHLIDVVIPAAQS